MKAAEGRILRSCDTCGQVDDHPRHVHDVTGAEVPPPVNTEAVEAVYATKGLDVRDIVRIVKELEDTTVLQKHVDCCREDGCPTGDCDSAPKKTGYALVEAITGEKVA
jgi:hypothetical protein